MKVNLENKRAMGVINITPDSFSDGGKFNSPESFKKQLESYYSWGVSCIDIGAESTAPFNDPISVDQELDRFQKIVFPSSDLIKSGTILSIDSYRAETFRELYHHFKDRIGDISIIWNDVSGVIDDGVEQLLLEEFPKCRYVFSHTGVNKREESSNHMQHVVALSPDEIVEGVINYFKNGLKFFSNKQLSSRIILDPCFGFSKDYDQNWRLINEIDKLVNHFPVEQSFLLGISRKSFLKKRVLLEGGSDSSDTEPLHALIISDWLKKLKNRLFIRLHDAASFNQVCSCFNQN